MGLPTMMIKVKLPDRTLGLSFKHSDIRQKLEKNVVLSHGKVVARNVPGVFRKTRATYCGIYEIGVGGAVKWLADGLATVGIGDNFNKATGRRIALTRALNELAKRAKISHFEREKVWVAYNDRGKNEQTTETVH